MTAGELFEYSVYRILKLVPTTWASAIGGFLARTNVRYFRKDILLNAIRNLKHHHPELSDAEVEAGAWRFLDNVGRMMGEFSVLHRLTVGKNLECVGFEALRDLQGKEPIFIITLHTGNWEVVGRGLQHYGIKVASFYQRPASRAQLKIALEARKLLGFDLFSPDPQGVRDAIRRLQNNGIVNIFGDEARRGRAMAPLFGRPAHENGNLAIAARLARKFNCRLLICYVERQPGCRFVLNFTPPFRLPDRDAVNVLDDVAFLNDQIEPIVLAHLDCWYFLDDSIGPLE